MFHITTFLKIVNVALEGEAIEQRVASTRQDERKKSAFSHLSRASWFRRSKKPQKTRRSGYDRRAPGESSSDSGLKLVAVSMTSPPQRGPTQDITPITSDGVRGSTKHFGRSYSMGGTIP